MDDYLATRDKIPFPCLRKDRLFHGQLLIFFFVNADHFACQIPF